MKVREKNEEDAETQIQETSTLPSRRAERLTIGDNFLDGFIVVVCCVQGGTVAPPCGKVSVGQLQSKENEDRGESKADVQTCRKDVVVERPPSTVLVSDKLVKDITDDTPGNVVERGCGRDQSGTTKDDGRVEVLDVAPWEHARTKVDDNRQQHAGNEEVKHRVVQLAWAKDTLGANGTPNNTGIEKDATVGAGEMVLLGLRAHVFDGA